MIPVTEKLYGVEYTASIEAWDLYFDDKFVDDGCGIKIKKAQLIDLINLLKTVTAPFELVDQLYEGYAFARKYGTKFLGIDLSVSCRLHDAEFSLKATRTEADFDQLTEWFKSNIESARQLPPHGFWGYVIRWTWARRKRDSLTRRIIRIYGIIAENLGWMRWES